MHKAIWMIGAGAALATMIAMGALSQREMAATSTARASPDIAMPDRIEEGTVYRAELGSVTTYRPTIPVRGVVLFLSGDGGWNQGVIDVAQTLAKQGIAIAGISTPTFRKALETGADRCINANFALSALAQDLEHEMRLDHYIKPIILGYSAGATIGYAALAQAPAGTYRGSVAIGFSPDVDGRKPWCSAKGFKPARIEKPATGWLFSPAPHLFAPWIVLQGVEDRVVSPATAGAFAARIPQAQFVELYKVGHSLADKARWLPALTAALAPMLEAPSAPGGLPNIAVTRIDDQP